jgi:UDP-glucose-4-epimerase GalE
MSKNVLVTGGAGFIGSHVCKMLAEYGYTPVTFDNLSTGHLEFVKWGPFVKGDLLHQEELMSVFSDYGIDTVIHLAGKAYVGESVLNPLMYYRENIQGSMNLIDVFLQNNGKSFIFSSSCATYGDPLQDLIKEDEIQNPINPYGFSKLAIEKLIINLKLLHSFNFAILRYFNAAGADSDLEIGERHKDETHVIPLLIKAAISGTEFNVLGDDFSTPDGSAIRDYTHVSDLAEAHVSALKAISNSKKDIVCNLGTGIGVSVFELIEVVRCLGFPVTHKVMPRRAGDPTRLVASNDLSRDKLKMTYKNSEISKILESAFKWHSVPANSPN